MKNQIAEKNNLFKTYISFAMAAVGYITAIFSFIDENILAGSLSIGVGLFFTATALLIFFDAKRSSLYCTVSVTLLFLIIFISFFTCAKDGFAMIWLMMFATVSVFFLGTKKGIIVFGITLITIASALFIPAISDNLAFSYSLIFKLKFIVLYIASGVLAVFVELIKNTLERDYNSRALQLEFLAKHDILTGVKNRTAFNQIYTSECENAQKTLGKLSLIISDLDNFKNINDTYGHLSGDKILKKVADIFKRESPNAEHIFRWGGEEFAVILQDADLECAIKTAENIRIALERMRVSMCGKEVGITASFGVTQVDLNNKLSASIKNADDALYEAKRMGRNAVKAHIQKSAILK